MFSLGKIIKVAKVPLVDDGALSAPVTFLVPNLTKLCVLAKSGHLIIFFTFGKSVGFSLHNTNPTSFDELFLDQDHKQGVVSIS